MSQAALVEMLGGLGDFVGQRSFGGHRRLAEQEPADFQHHGQVLREMVRRTMRVAVQPALGISARRLGTD
ncbi:MAG: hypothetical protein QM775_33700 [Pirellulales bacterium]